MIYSLCSQGWYIGITAASQAVKAGSTPVPCSKKSPRLSSWTFFGFRGTSKCSAEVNSACANAFAQQKHFTAQKRRGGAVRVGVPAPDEGARRCCHRAARRDGSGPGDDGDCAALYRGFVGKVPAPAGGARRCCRFAARRDGAQARRMYSLAGWTSLML